MIDPLEAALSLSIDLGDTAQELLRDEAEAFLLSGGHVSLREWATLSTRSRAALAAAGQSLRTARSALVAEEVARHLTDVTDDTLDGARMATFWAAYDARREAA